jgi:hypothetical protein
MMKKGMITALLALPWPDYFAGDAKIDGESCPVLQGLI